METYKHPAYGMIRFARVSGHAKFFGSELEQDHYIVCEISHAELHRDLAREWYFGKDEIIKVRLSAVQFAELLTNMNAQGVPCTIEHIQHNKMPELEKIETLKSYIQTEYAQRLSDRKDDLEDKAIEAEKILKKDKLSKQDREFLLSLISSRKQSFDGTSKFYLESFQEVAERVVVEAKSEVESAILYKINSLGLQALHEQNKLLNAGEKTDGKE